MLTPTPMDITYIKTNNAKYDQLKLIKKGDTMARAITEIVTN
jgi:hypothetical protein